jgi:hypothetical protein
MRSANLIENETKNSDFNDINVENISEMRFKKMNIKYENIVEMIRRLQNLPAKLFGEDVRTLQIRLLKAEAEIKNKVGKHFNGNTKRRKRTFKKYFSGDKTKRVRR